MQTNMKNAAAFVVRNAEDCSIPKIVFLMSIVLGILCFIMRESLMEINVFCYIFLINDFRIPDLPDKLRSRFVRCERILETAHQQLTCNSHQSMDE